MSESQIRRVKRHLISWGSGRRHGLSTVSGRTRTVTLSRSEHLDDLLDSGWVGEGSVVLAPDAVGQERDGISIVGYSGHLAKPGHDLSIGEDFYLQTQAYTATRYMSVLGPTFVRVVSTADLTALADDVHVAAQRGIFPEAAPISSVIHADRPAWDGDHRDGPHLRLHVDLDGIVSLSPTGRPLGCLDDSFDQLTSAYSALNERSPRRCTVSIGAAVSDQERERVLTSRPGTARFLHAVDALKTLASQDIDSVRVSGFAHRVEDSHDGDLTQEELSRPGMPVLTWQPETDTHYLVEPERGRIFALSRETAAATEALLLGGASNTPDDSTAARRARSLIADLDTTTKESS